MNMERIIYIKNLHPEVDAYILSEIFSKCGKILSVSIDYDENFKSLCKGQILFEQPSSIKAALRKNRAIISGISINVYPSNKKMDVGKIHKMFKKIFVKNIDLSWDDVDLMENFKTFGEIDSVQISTTDEKSNGYGFVTYKEHSSAKQAVENMNDKVISNKVLKVEPFVPKELREDTNSSDNAKVDLEKAVQLNNLHVKNLPKHLDIEEFKNLFSKFGVITSLKIATDEKGESKGFGFVAFESEKDAATAHFRMNKYSIGSNILEVNFNQRKEYRQKLLQLNSKSEKSCAETGKHSHVKEKHFPRLKSGNQPSRCSSQVIFSFKT